jgi:hypothetical protein
VANADYLYDNAINPADDAEKVARLMAPPPPPAPPAEDNPIVAFAKGLLSPLQGYGSGGASYTYGTSPATPNENASPIGNTAGRPIDYSPGLNAVSDFGRNLDNTFLVGGLKTPINDVGTILGIGAPQGLDPNTLIYEPSNDPRYASAPWVDPAGSGRYSSPQTAAASAALGDRTRAATNLFGTTVGGSEVKLAGPALGFFGNQVARRVVGPAASGLGSGVRGALDNPLAQRFATEEAGLGRVDLGLTGAAPNPAAVARETAPFTPGFMQTAEQRIAGAGVTQRQVSSELGLNLSKVDAPQSVKDYIVQTAKENAGFMDQRRGVVTIAEQNAAAAAHEIDIAKYAYLKPGTAMNAETLTSVFGAVVKKGKEVTGLQDIIRQEAAMGIVSKENQLRLLLATSEHQTLQRVYAGGRAEAGRSLRALQEVQNGLNAGQINNAYDRASAILGGNDKLGALVDTLQKIWTDPALDGVARETATYRFVQNLDNPKFFDRLYSFWLNSVLSGVKTHVVNVTGQGALMFADISSKTLSAGIEVTSTVGGLRRPREVFFSEALAGPFGAIMGLPRGFRMAGQMLKNGVTAEQVNKFVETGRLGSREVNAGLLNIPTRLLGAEDQVFYATGYSRGLYEKAANIAASERQSILNGNFGTRMADLLSNPTDAMMTYADEMGKRAGLRSDPGKINAAVLKLRDINVLPESITKYTGEFQPLRYVIPFVNTPTQLVKIGAEYSPFGLTKLITAKGGQRSDILARSLLGSTGMAILASKYADGNITGGAPTNPAERDAFYASGKLPYSIKLGNEWVSFERLEPIATPLKWTAALMDVVKQNPGKPVDVVAGKMVGALARSLSDSTYFSGFSDLIDAIDDPERSAPKFLARIAGGFVPRALTTAVQATDKYIRDPEGIIEQIESTLPFLNDRVHPRTTNYGEPALRSEGKQGIAGYFSPVDFNTAQVDPITQRLQQYRLPESFDANGVQIPARAMLVGAVGQDIAAYKLNSDEGRSYQQYAGQATYNMLGKLFNDKIPYDGKPFSALDEPNQVRAIRKTIADARQVGRAQVADEIMHSATTDDQRQRAADMRVSTIGSRKDRAQYIEGLKASGNLSPAVASYLDQHRDKGEPSTAEYLRAAPLVREYLAMPPYRIGDAAEWERLKVVRAAASKYAQTIPHPPGITEAQLYMRVDPAGAALLHRYSSPLASNPNRERLLRANPWLEPFLG